MRTVSTSPSLFRLLLLGLVLVTVLVKPVLAFDCVFPDAAQQSAQADRSPGVADVSAAAGVDDCCPFQDCHDCCAHTTAVLPADGFPAFAHPAATIPLLVATSFRPYPPLSVFRPPIAS